MSLTLNTINLLLTVVNNCHHIVEEKERLGDRVWCILKDFNVLSMSDEWRGVLGHMFTWYHPNEIAMSQINKVLISNVWANRSLGSS